MQKYTAKDLIIMCIACALTTLSLCAIQARGDTDISKVQCGELPFTRATMQENMKRNTANYGYTIAYYCNEVGWLSVQAIQNSNEIVKLNKRIRALVRIIKNNKKNRF